MASQKEVKIIDNIWPFSEDYHVWSSESLVEWFTQLNLDFRDYAQRIHTLNLTGSDFERKLCDVKYLEETVGFYPSEARAIVKAVKNRMEQYRKLKGAGDDKKAEEASNQLDDLWSGFPPNGSEEMDRPDDDDGDDGRYDDRPMDPIEEERDEPPSTSSSSDEIPDGVHVDEDALIDMVKSSKQKESKTRKKLKEAERKLAEQTRFYEKQLEEQKKRKEEETEIDFPSISPMPSPQPSPRMTGMTGTTGSAPSPADKQAQIAQMKEFYRDNPELLKQLLESMGIAVPPPGGGSSSSQPSEIFSDDPGPYPHPPGPSSSSIASAYIPGGGGGPGSGRGPGFEENIPGPAFGGGYRPGPSIDPQPPGGGFVGGIGGEMPGGGGGGGGPGFGEGGGGDWKSEEPPQPAYQIPSPAVFSQDDRSGWPSRKEIRMEDNQGDRYNLRGLSPPPDLPLKSHPPVSMTAMTNKFRMKGANKVLYPPKNGPRALARYLGMNEKVLPNIDLFDELTPATIQEYQRNYRDDLSRLNGMGFTNLYQNIRGLMRHGHLDPVIDELSQMSKRPGLFIGDRVTRGPDWKWGDQDGGTMTREHNFDRKEIKNGQGVYGTVRGIRQWHPNDRENEPTSVIILWDVGLYGNYRYGYRGAYDVALFQQCEKLDKEISRISVGDRVLRAKPNWRWGDQDGGTTKSYGTVVELYASPAPFEGGARVSVLWDKDKDAYKNRAQAYQDKITRKKSARVRGVPYDPSIDDTASEKSMYLQNHGVMDVVKKYQDKLSPDTREYIRRVSHLKWHPHRTNIPSDDDSIDTIINDYRGRSSNIKQNRRSRRRRRRMKRRNKFLRKPREKLDDFDEKGMDGDGLVGSECDSDWDEVDFDDILAKPIPRYRWGLGDSIYDLIIDNSIAERLSWKDSDYLMIDDVCQRGEDFDDRLNSISGGDYSNLLPLVLKVEQWDSTRVNPNEIRGDKIFLTWSTRYGFRFDYKGKFDVVYKRRGHVFFSPFARIRVGDRVTRGFFWCYDDEDGGVGSRGTVVALQYVLQIAGVLAKVRWERNNHLNTYAWNFKGISDIKVVPDPAKQPGAY